MRSLFILMCAFLLVSCNEQLATGTVRKLSFALTNDIHGHLEPKVIEQGKEVGGLSYYAQLIKALQSQAEYKEGASALFVLDAGDQFQGTLLSNYDEGETMFKAFNEIGYDAVVPGNHDYDFGPLGWLFDKVTPGSTSDNPREAISHLAAMAKFPLLSANTFYKKSLSTTVALDAQCNPINQTLQKDLDFTQAVRPSFLKPYTIIKKAGVRVALIGLDNRFTPSTTTPENVSDLCFRNEVDAYLDVRRELVNDADVFVLILHGGNTSNNHDASSITEAINTAYPNGVNLVAAGHTHVIHNDNIDGVYVIQDGAEGQHFGLVNLYWDSEQKKILKDQTESTAGLQITHDSCPTNASTSLCGIYPVPLTTNKTVDELISTLKQKIAPIADQVLATASETIRRDRISENAMGNILTDALRISANVQVALMNMGGIRADLKPGTITFSKFFEVLPFNNQAVVIQSLPWKVLKKVLAHSIQTCGKFGTLAQSGLNIKFKRTCSPNSDIDYDAQLIKVERLAKDEVPAQVLFDQELGIEAAADDTTSLVTLDFIAAGGSGYEEFAEIKDLKAIGIARELIAQELSRTKPVLTNSIDRRTTTQRTSE